MEVPEIIVCVDCGQNARMLSHPPEDGWQAGDIVAYRCTGCRDRWDLVVEESSGTVIVDSPFAAEIAAVRESLRRKRQTD